ncbi:MAG TPA: glycosyltransferase [Chloroflexi bacterium]|nr:glycosyltransferase [Chloroflexota bacterium]
MSARLLYLTPDLPFPPHQGAAIRTYNFLKNLAGRHEIHLLSFADGEAVSRRIQALSIFCATVTTVRPPNRSTARRALSVLASPLPDMALRLPSPEFTNQLRITLDRDRFDFVQVEAIEMAQYGLLAKKLASKSAPRVVFDDINAEYLLQKRAFEADARRPKRWLGALYSLVQWRKLQRYEAQVCRQVDKVVVVSQADCGAIRCLVPELQCVVVPNGVDTDYFRPAGVEMESDLDLVFTGKMDFRPNVDAMLWFAQEVLPLISKQVQQARITVVGRDPHPRLAAVVGLPNVSLTGYVDDVRPFVARAGVYVVPLKVGGGTRLKLLQAMSMGKAIVSTSLGCEGLELEPGRHLLIADDAASFAEAVVALIRDPQRRGQLGRAARELALANHDWRQITPLLEQVYES